MQFFINFIHPIGSEFLFFKAPSSYFVYHSATLSNCPYKIEFVCIFIVKRAWITIKAAKLVEKYV